MSAVLQPAVSMEPAVAAKAAGLRYVSPDEPGIRRLRHGKGFRYVGPDGRPVRDEATLARIRKLAIPPAWEDVWVCAREDGHLQATGRDARGRKQYRYHAEWRRARDETKFDRMLAFGKALPRIRARVEEDLRLPGLPREKVLATIVRLLDTTYVRVGNDEYRRSNGSHGLTTLQDRHVTFPRGRARFSFRGKAGKRHVVEVDEPRLARIVKRCQDLPGQELFQYEDDEGAPRSVGSADVNAYLREIAGDDFTAKDFRTWAGTVLAADALQEAGPSETKADAKRQATRAVERVAAALGNTPTVCRKCYVHPDVLEAYLDGTFERLTRAALARKPPARLDPEEAVVLSLLADRR